MSREAHTVEDWIVGQHPAMESGWIVRPVLFGSRVRVLPECEGGHVVIKSERDARLIAAAPALLEALRPFADVLADVGEEEGDEDLYRAMSRAHRRAPAITVGHLRHARAAIHSATGEG